MPAAFTYSFLDTQASINGPGVSIPIGAGSGAAEEGITVTPSEDIGGMTIGADGAGMHSLYANKSGMITIRLLKTSPINQVLSAAQNFQRTSGAAYGQNTISLVNTLSGDAITGQFCAFKKVPDLTYAKDGNTVEWEFNVVILDIQLGAGVEG